MNRDKQKLFLSAPEFDGTEMEFVKRAMDLGQIATNGPFISEFERKLQDTFNAGNVIALNSGTSSIHLALHLLGVGPGDEVICQTFTFIASSNPVVYLGAQPVFVDSETDTWNMCPHALEATIQHRLQLGKKPKAIIVVNLFGMPAKLPEIMALGKKYEIPVIEDAAESVGSKIGGQFTGTFGDLGIYSFNGNKIITTGGGGALVTSSRFMANKSRYLSTQAKLNFHHYEHRELGYNYKMNNLTAGIGIAQLSCLEDKIAKRREIHQYYHNHLSHLPGITFLDEPEGYFSNRWLTTILIDSELAGFESDDLREALLSKNIESRFLWKPMHLQPLYKNAPYYGGNYARALFHQGLCLPSGGGLTNAGLNRVIDCIFELHTCMLMRTEKSM
ncbi:MAG: aminotransferase class V-fold PLP-dependent enzyme [Cyclobacteriaceae bacterium]